MTQQKQSNLEWDHLCLIGAISIDQTALLDWLEQSEKRRLFLIGCKAELLHPRIRAYEADTLMKEKIAANEVGWSAVMQPLEIRAAEGWEETKRRVLESHMAARLLFSGVADLGIEAYANARANWKRGPFVSISSLKGCLTGVPAIVAGAGPSLEEALPTLKEAASRALLIGSGTALSLFGKWGIEPHLSCVLDKRTFPKFVQSAKESFFCVQSRLNPEALAEIAGTKILAPEAGPLPWESWWLGEKGEFEAGCTVGNFAAHVAAYLGCSPILCVGMDLCYRGEVKYAEKHEQEKFELIEVQNRKGEPVFTQRDWFMAARWHQALALQYPDRRWISTAQEGLFLGDLVNVLSWNEAISLLGREVDAKERLSRAIQEAPEIVFSSEKDEEWQASLARSLKICSSLDEGGIEEEAVYQYYLAPLWNLWRPVFQRETKNEEELSWFRRLFFQKVLTKLGSGSFL